MAAGPSVSVAVIITAVLLFLAVSPAASDDDQHQQQTYIVHVSRSHKPAHYTSHRHWYTATVASLPPSPHPARLLYTYDHAARGFSARLSPSQAAALRSIPAILSVSADRVRQLHITHTPTFLGLRDDAGLWPNSDYAEDVVVGVLDTGIWPERQSFSDEGLSPVPAWWKGKCVVADDFPAQLCNRKLIGARAYYLGHEAAMGRRIGENSAETISPRDTEGHGTHTASTAAGAVVPDAGFYDYARGEAKGMASKARIAVYKICWILGCYDSDILAGMDQAVADGVNIISLSVGSNGYSPPYEHDSIAIGAFGAMENGVVVSCSAGNSGPGPHTAVNIAPWILTVGASTVDREFPADVVLGDGERYGGVSLYAGEPLAGANYSLVYAGDCGSRLCLERQLDPVKVAGKIVLCDRGSNARVAKGGAVKEAGGAGMILANTEESGEELIADSHIIPATMVGQAAGDKIRAYTQSQASSPTATIVFRGTVIGAQPSAPKVAAFSSRGPNYRTPEILKPDVVAPGVNILAGWTGAASPTDLDMDARRVEFNIISGTSMSCPHVSGLAALLRKAYPSWTPAAIKSALMTTAYNVDSSGEIISDLATGEASTPYIRGAGHVDPNKALRPGLVYDITPTDYVAFLCTIGYEAQQIAVFSKSWSEANCSALAMASPGDLNYPSFSVVFKPEAGTVEYHRTVTNVGGSSDAVYEAEVEAPAGLVDVEVSPAKLVFSADEQRLSYTVRFTSLIDGWKSSGVPSLGAGAITWTDGLHVVRSPVAFLWWGSPIASF